MKLESIEYAHFQGTDREWKLENTDFGIVNLIVGKNASGKSRTVNLISVLAGIVSGESKPRFMSGSFSVKFKDAGSQIDYFLEMRDLRVLKETYHIDSEPYLIRDESGKGRIKNSVSKNMVEFQIQNDESAVHAKLDFIQHSFLEKIFSWGKNFRCYHFGTDFGKRHFVVYRNDVKESLPNLKQFTEVVEIFRTGEKNYSKKFTESVYADMSELGYEIEQISVKPISMFKVKLENEEENLYGLIIKEKGIQFPIEQNEISQGMFRALSLIVQLNYSVFSGQTSCIVIDDIGEGLDFERSSTLIDLVIRKSESFNIQLIMTTNDRFVMNRVPIEYWSVIRREPGRSKIFNYKNSKENFDQFGYTGLNNFDFFTTEFYARGLQPI